MSAGNSCQPAEQVWGKRGEGKWKRGVEKAEEEEAVVEEGNH
jgi:subtilisin-like proprotein convertase family protein